MILQRLPSVHTKDIMSMWSCLLDSQMPQLHSSLS
uniref:Uncharacterized protein n=1 Tax=Arundo donax TaxID=35708 RepID=A0A0A8YQP6_ARUDO